VDDSEREKEIREKIEMEQIEMIRKQKSEDNIDVAPKQGQSQSVGKADEGRLVVQLSDTVEPFMPADLAAEI
jgi:hypothetical protein